MANPLLRQNLAAAIARLEQHEQSLRELRDARRTSSDSNELLYCDFDKYLADIAADLRALEGCSGGSVEFMRKFPNYDHCNFQTWAMIDAWDFTLAGLRKKKGQSGPRCNAEDIVVFSGRHQGDRASLLADVQSPTAAFPQQPDHHAADVAGTVVLSVEGDGEQGVVIKVERAHSSTELAAWPPERDSASQAYEAGLAHGVSLRAAVLEGTAGLSSNGFGDEDSRGDDITDQVFSHAVGTIAEAAYPVASTLEQVQNPQPYTRLYYLSHIIYTDELGWIELRCCFCNGNCKHVPLEPYRGIYAFKRHIEKVHGQTGLSLGQVASICRHAGLSQEEVETIFKTGHEALKWIARIPVKAQPDTDEHLFWTHAVQRENFEERLQCIVKDFGGTYYELACPISGCNAPKSSKGKYFAGVIGLNDHIRVSHPAQELPGLQVAFQECQVRSLSSAEVRAMRVDEILAPQLRKAR